MNWQSMETAPKDRRILLYYPKPLFNNVYCVVGEWESDRYAKCPKPYWSHDMERLYGVANTRKTLPTLWADIELPKED